MNTHIWYPYFKERIEHSGFQMPSEGSSLAILKALMDAEIISNSEYLSWALTHYQLPVLNSHFFKETRGSAEFYRKWATKFNWSNECLPVAEWDGALIVACLAPPQGLSVGVPHIIILAGIEDLETRWQQYGGSATSTNAGSSAKAKIPTNEEVPQGFLQDTKAGAPSDSVSFDDLGISLDKSDEAVDSLDDSEDSESSEGLNDEESADGLLDLNFTTEENNSAPLVNLGTNSILRKNDSPSPLQVAAENIPSDSFEKTNVYVPEDSAIQASPSEPLKELKPAPKVAAQTEKVAIAPTRADLPPPPENTFVGENNEESSYNSGVNNLTSSSESYEPDFSPKPRTGNVSKPTFNPAASASFALEKLKRKDKSLVENKIAHIFSEMENHFEKVMVLALDEESSQISAFAWDSGFETPKDTTLRIPLQTPSIFNIPVSTQKPFHGYISLNPINETFFENWTDSVIPDHVTITPIIQQDTVIGLIMGVGKKSAYNQKSLSIAEELAQQFCFGFANAA